MKNIKLVTIILSAVLIFKLAIASNLDAVTPADAFKMQQDNQAVIVDVREADETNLGKIKNAKLIPLSLMEKNSAEFDKLVNDLPKDKKILVYCRSGRRSGIVGEELQKRKFNVLNLGGFEAWKKAGFPVE